MNTQTIIMLVAAAIMAFIAVNWSYFKILKIAKDKNLVDNPDARKLQKAPIPVMGGIASFMGVTVGMLTASAIVGIVPGLTSTAYILPVTMAMIAMLYVGAMDDIVGLTPRSRLVIEVLTVLGLVCAGGGCIDSLHGVWGVEQFSWWVAVPLTVFAGVGIVNAVNMVDGVNGLSSGLCMAVSGMFAIAFLKSGDTSNAVLALVMVASLLPFYVHNVFGNRSRMFIGDAGTMVMGIVLVWFTISVLRSDSPVQYYSLATGVGLVAMMLAFMSVPVFDTLRVMTMRMVHGRSPFSPDKTHLHHVFIAAGVSHFVTSSSVILIDLLVTLGWAIAVKCGMGVTGQLWLVIGLSVLLVWGTYGFIHYHAVHHTRFMHWLSHFSVSTHFGRKEWWKAISRWLDAPEGEEVRMMDVERMAHLERKFEHVATPKDDDRKKVFDYIKGKAEVHVRDIEVFSGVEKMRLYPILFEMELEGVIEVIERDAWGAATIVAIV